MGIMEEKLEATTYDFGFRVRGFWVLGLGGLRLRDF